MEHKKHPNDEEDINQRLLREIDMVSDCVYEQAWWSNCTMGCVNTSLFPVVCSLLLYAGLTQVVGNDRCQRKISVLVLSCMEF
ncbi:hypothetical protein BS78_05G240800 [Paspalum vaginatum]|nr:hypothetical protein BS78_05G240800 [Paspalum vaginatum]